MLRISTTKAVATLAVILVGLMLAVPSFFTADQRSGFIKSLPPWFPTWIVPTRAIVLGLDLQGGSQIVLEVDRNDLGRTMAQGLRDDVRQALRESGVQADGGIQLQPRGVQLRVGDAANRAKVMPKLQALSQPVTDATLGQTGARTLDVREEPNGLIQLTYTDAGFNARTRRAVQQAIEVVRRRIDVTGTTEPSIQQQGTDRILVQLPGVQDPQRIETLLQGTAKLEFRLLADSPAGDVDMLVSKDANSQ